MPSAATFASCYGFVPDGAGGGGAAALRRALGRADAPGGRALGGDAARRGQREGRRARRGRPSRATSTPPPAGAPSVPAGLARALREHGVVRLDGALARGTALALRDAVLDERDARAPRRRRRRGAPADRFRSVVGYDGGAAAQAAPTRARDDVLLPLAGCAPLAAALRELLGAARAASARAGGGAAPPEAAGCRSRRATRRRGAAAPAAARDPRGARRKRRAALRVQRDGERAARAAPLHPDTPHQGARGDDAVAPLYSVFVALQDVAPAMGPTLFAPRTHTAAAHAAFLGDDARAKAALRDAAAQSPGRARLRAGGSSSSTRGSCTRAARTRRARTAARRARCCASRSGTRASRASGTSARCGRAGRRPAHARGRHARARRGGRPDAMLCPSRRASVSPARPWSRTGAPRELGL